MNSLFCYVVLHEVGRRQTKWKREEIGSRFSSHEREKARTCSRLKLSIPKQVIRFASHYTSQSFSVFRCWKLKFVARFSFRSRKKEELNRESTSFLLLIKQKRRNFFSFRLSIFSLPFVSVLSFTLCSYVATCDDDIVKSISVNGPRNTKKS
jgi:hypothetical protein